MTLLERIFKQFASSKLKIQTLVDIFSSFLKNFDKTDMTFQTSYHSNGVSFDYDSKNWTATFTKEFSRYDGKKIKFINIKLPLDGFVLTSTYSHPTKSDELKYNDETKEFINLLSSIIPFKNMEISAYCKLEDSRLEFYFWNADVEDECVTIKFENGTYNYFVNRKRYTLEEINKMIS